MANRTERADEIFWTVIGIILSIILYFLAYAFFMNGKFAFGVTILMGAFSATFFTLFCVSAALIRRWAEQRIWEDRERKG